MNTIDNEIIDTIAKATRAHTSAFVSANLVAETGRDPSDDEVETGNDPDPSSAWPPVTVDGEIDYASFSWP